MNNNKHFVPGRVINSKLEPVEKGYVMLRECNGNEELILNAARVSHGNAARQLTLDEHLIRFMWRHGHTSPFEHISFTFLIKCPIFIARQWFRHRTGKYNEVSGRYTQMEDQFWMPEISDLRNQSVINHQCSGTEVPNATEELMYAEESIKIAYTAYENLIKSGVSREMARAVLPASIMTKFYFTIDLHNLLHFLKLRLAADAQPEIRYYAEAIKNIIMPHIPMTWQAFEDFTLNAVTLTWPDIKVLQTLNIQVLAQTDGKFKTKREENEFNDKVKKMFKAEPFGVPHLRGGPTPPK